jgi:hypothetical protein
MLVLQNMARVTDKNVDAPEPPDPEPAGRVEFDSRGNSVWRWARDVIESTSVLLKRLDNKDLALEPTQKVPIMRGGAPGAKRVAAAKAGDAKPAASHPAKKPDRRDGGGGFDPYNSR